MRKLFALFVALIATATLVFAENPSQTVSCGDQVTIKANPATHYHFVQWSDGNINVKRTVTVNEALTLTATFAEDTYYTLTLGNQIIITSGESANGRYYPGDQVTIQAVPNALDQCEEFKYWADDANNTTATRTITFDNSNLSISAVFGAKLVTITIQSEDEAKGTVEFVTD